MIITVYNILANDAIAAFMWMMLANAILKHNVYRNVDC